MKRFTPPNFLPNQITSAIKFNESDFGIESFNNEVASIMEDFEYINKVTLEGFSDIKNKVVEAIKMMFKKIRELISRFINWFKGKSKNDVKKAEEAKKAVKTVYQEFEELFADPDTRELAIEKLKGSTRGYFFTHIFLDQFFEAASTVDKDGVLAGILLNDSIFTINFFSVDIYQRDSILDGVRNVVGYDGLDFLENNMQKAIDGTLTSDDITRERGSLDSAMTDIQGRFELFATALLGEEYKDKVGPDQLLLTPRHDWTAIVKERLEWFMKPSAEPFRDPTHFKEIMDDVEQINIHKAKCMSVAEKIAQTEADAYKFESQYLNKLKEKQGDETHSVNMHIVQNYFRTIFTIVGFTINTVDTFDKIYSRVTTAVLNNCMNFGKFLDSIKKEAKKTATTESISFQDGNFFKLLTDKIGGLRAGRNYTPKNLEKLGIDALVAEHTGLRIVFGVDPSTAINAYVMLPHVDKNHPFFQQFWRDNLPSEGIQMIRAAGGSLKGGVDLKNARVTGVYTEIEARVCLNKGLLEHKDFTDEEVCSILMHELGHLFTYFEMFGRINRTANIIAAMTKSTFGIEDQATRETIIKEAAKSLQISLEDPSQLANLPKGRREETCATIFITKVVHSSRTESGEPFYEMRSCEQLADDFAIRMGSGRHLASGLHKLYTKFGESSTMSSTKHVIMQIFETLLIVGWGVGISAMITGAAATAVTISVGAVFMPFMLLLLAEPSAKIYDNGEDRIKLMKRNLVDAIKNPKISDQLRESYLGEIKAIDELSKNLDYKRGWIEYLITQLGPRGSKNYKQELIMKDVENLLTNDIFVRANQFRAEV